MDAVRSVARPTGSILKAASNAWHVAIVAWVRAGPPLRSFCLEPVGPLSMANALAINPRDPVDRAGVEDALLLTVRAIEEVAPDTCVFDLRPANGDRVPPFEAGAHIALDLPNGMRRSYSLINAPGDRRAYRIAVARDRCSRGGSVCLHDQVTPGMTLRASPPCNTFPLVEDSRPVVLIAGGIGITPLWSMVQRLNQRGHSWHLHYACRSRTSAAFLAELEQAADDGKGSLSLWFDDEQAGRPFDMATALDHAPADSHLYCCGPAPMLDAFRAGTAGRFPADRVHLEVFKADGPQEDRPLGGFVVELARSGREVEVPEGSTILDALMLNGIDAPYSCYEGLCGTCETRVLAGTPDHRDQILTDRARASNDTVIICCSGSVTPRLVIDL